MVQALPFRALRFHSNRVDVEKVVAPARSRIPSASRSALLDADPRNMAHVVYAEHEEGDAKKDDDPFGEAPLRRGAALLADWQRAGLLVPDDIPSFYLFRQTFTRDEDEDDHGKGESTSRYGVFVCLDLDADAVANILPHEKILENRALGVEHQREILRVLVEPVFLTYRDEKRKVHRAVRSYFEEEPDLVFDFDDVMSEMWIIDDETTCARIQAHLDETALYIADGHHRMASFARELEHKKSAGEENPKTQATAFLVAVSEPGLLVRATHRTFSFADEVNVDELLEKLSQTFVVSHLENPIHECEELAETLRSAGIAFILVSKSRQHLLRLEIEPESLFHDEEHQKHYLDTSIVERVIFQALQEKAPNTLMDFDRDLHKVLRDVDHGEGRRLACLVQAPTLEAIYAISDEGKTVCPKSTAFMPRLPIGICMAHVSTLKEDAQHD
ncbi:MAG: DUF1015 domain-containing protein [Deltaproteobacteria bacterium]|nr:DUF1015 domain-containing protein [Deltaproteobacteria bacterium]